MILKFEVTGIGTLDVIIDDEDYLLVKGYNWKLTYKEKNWYVYAHPRIGEKQKDTRRKRVTLYLHRLITKCPEGLVVDHINGNGLDNRRSNLRVCTTKENNYNFKQTKKNKTTKYIGVSICKTHISKNRVNISIDNKVKNLGYYYDEDIAAACYDSVAFFLRGEICRMNFPDRIEQYKKLKQLGNIKEILAFFKHEDKIKVNGDKDGK